MVDDFPVVIATLGGSGTRLYPLTLFQSKPLIPIVNYPIFMRMIEVLGRGGAREFIFSTKGIENTLRIKDVFRYGADFSARLELPRRVKFMYQPHYKDMGSADSVRFAMQYYNINRDILVVSGDNIASVDLPEIKKAHKTKKALATIVLKELPLDANVSNFGVAEVDDDNRIVRFVEKPKPGETDSRLINASIYMFSADILQILKEMGEKARDIGRDLMPYLIEKGYAVYGYNCKGYWADVGTPDSFLKTSLDIVNQKVENIRFRKAHEVKDGIWIHPTTLSRMKGGKMPDVKRNTVIGGDCDIDSSASIENSSVGDNCVIADNVRIKNSVVMDFVNIEANVTLNSCIVGRYVTVGEGSIIDADISVDVPGMKERTPVVGDGVTIVRHSYLGAYKRVAPISYSHTILKSDKFKDLGYDEHNIYFIEK